MKRLFISAALICFLSGGFFSVSAQQIGINRIDQMPNFPYGYEMRDWKKVALGYDSLIFDFNRTGEHLPLVSWMTNTVNYPAHNCIYLHTVVGTTYPSSSEAINVLPAIIGASLAGIDKSDHNGYNWVLFCEEFFNRRPEENVYLNHPVSESGDDWWYATMPNIFFYQLYSLYPGTGDFEFQFGSVADQWLAAVKAMGAGGTPWTLPDMDHRGWHLATMTPYDDGVHQPEAAGAIGWLLYQAYVETGQAEYLAGAEWAMEFLSGWPVNPSYELQLSYGAYIAARMNAEMGTGYDIEKIVNWCFDVGPLRGWGALLGRWAVYDVYGLIGAAGGSGDYAFIMNTFEQIGALVPMVRYDDRFARAIGKWVLNAANACRLFYPKYLSDLNQDSEEWAREYDPHSYIAHEGMRKQTNGFPYATGDAISGGWGATNLVLYGSSHVGILGGIIDTTSEKGILQLDLLKTDYFHDEAWPSYLYYNPYNQEKVVSVNTGNGSYDLYDAVTNEMIATGVTGITSIAIPADAAVLLVILPAGGRQSFHLNQLLVDGVVADYRSGQTAGNYPPRIKSLAALAQEVNLNDSTAVFCTAVDKDSDPVGYLWQADDGRISGTGGQVKWIAPDSPGSYLIRCIADDGNGGKDTAGIGIRAVERINTEPVIHRIEADPRKIDLGAAAQLTCKAGDADGDQLSYHWSCPEGTLAGDDSVAAWTAPMAAGDYTVSCRIDDGYGGSALDSIVLAVRDLSIIQTGDLVAFYPFNGNADDASSAGNNGSVQGPVLTGDRFGSAGKAYLFDGINDYILVPNAASLNFQKSISVNFWIKVTEFFDGREAYPLSHGNWERRWKFSISNRRVRWTVKTDVQVRDIDSDFELAANTFYNITGIYDGSDFEIYINGKLNNFTHLSGSILTTTIALTIGQVLPDNNQHNFKGVIDDVRIYNYALSLAETAALYDLGSAVGDNGAGRVPSLTALGQNFPNPFNNRTTMRYQLHKPSEVRIRIYDILGQRIADLADQAFPAGYHEIAWDGRNNSGQEVNSGIYICEFRAGNVIRHRKIILIR